MAFVDCKRIGKKAQRSPWLLIGTVSPQLSYFSHVAGPTQVQQWSFPDDEHLRLILRWSFLRGWSDKREAQKENKIKHKKRRFLKRFLSDVVADTLCALDSRTTHSWLSSLINRIELWHWYLVCKTNSCLSYSVLTAWIFQPWSYSNDRCAKWGVALPISQKLIGLIFCTRQSS